MSDWKTSSFCGNSSCVEASFDELPGYVAVASAGFRGEAVFFTHAEWDAFIAGVKNNEFDRPVQSGGEAVSKTNPPALKNREQIEQRLALICADYEVNLTHVIQVATEMDTRSGEKDVEQGGAE